MYLYYSSYHCKFLCYRYLVEFSLQGDRSHEQGKHQTIGRTHAYMMSTGSDDQQLPTAVTAAGEEVVSEASDVDEPTNAEGQYIQYILLHLHSNVS